MKFARLAIRFFLIFSGIILMFVELPSSLVYGQTVGLSVKPQPEPLSFDVVSIRPDQGNDFPQVWYQLGGRFRVKNFALGEMVYAAYEIMNSQLVSGIPRWAMSQHYDIEASVAEQDIAAYNRLDEHQRKLLWQSVLKDRCGLKVHSITKEVSANVLTVSKSGIKMKSVVPSDADKANLPDGKTFSPSGSHLNGVGVPMSRIVRSITSITHSLVVDRTGLTGNFDYDLRWDRDWATESKRDKDVTDPVAGVTPFMAVKEQLGLVLTPTKLQMPVLVVDHLGECSAN